MEISGYSWKPQIYSLFGKLTQKTQGSDEDVLSFANSLRVLGSQILELKVESNVTGYFNYIQNWLKEASLG